MDLRKVIGRLFDEYPVATSVEDFYPIRKAVTGFWWYSDEGHRGNIYLNYKDIDCVVDLYCVHDSLRIGYPYKDKGRNSGNVQATSREPIDPEKIEGTIAREIILYQLLR